MKHRIKVILSRMETVEVDLGMVNDNDHEVMDNLEWYAKRKLGKDTDGWEIASATEDGKLIKFLE